MSGHNRHKGFSQTSKRYDGALKTQHQAARSKQIDHSADVHDEAEASSGDLKSKEAGKKSKH